MKHLLLAAAALLLACPGSTPPPTDTGPKLVSTTPAAMATDVSLTTLLSLEFSAEMAIDTVAVTLSPQVELGAPTWDEAHTSVSLQPTAPLQPGTQYTVRVTGSDPQMRKLVGDTAFAFTTANVTETTAPTLVSSTPADAAMNVAITTALALTFSEAMDQSSLVVTASPAFDFGTPTWSTDGTTVSFSGAPTAMQEGTDYTVSLSGADLAGNTLADPTVIHFTTTAPADTQAPTVVAASPSAGATGVTTNVQPSVTFSEAMLSTSTGSLRVSPDAGCNPTLDPTSTVLTCARTGNLAPNTPFTVTVLATAAKDVAGNPMAADFSFTFTTGNAADVTAPTVLAMAPAPDAGYPATQAMAISFSEPMNQSVTQAAFGVTAPAGKELFYSWTDGGTVLTVVADGGWASGDQVQWGVSAAATDLAGNPLGAASTSSFRVMRSCTALLPSMARADGTARSTAQYSPVVTRPVYGFTNTGLLQVGRAANSTTETLYRSLLEFDFSATGADCSKTSVPAGARRITAASLAVTQVVGLGGGQGAPFGPPLSRPVGAVVVDWVELSPDAGAGALFLSKYTCDGGTCPSVLSSTTLARPPAANVTALVEQVRARRPSSGNYAFQLRAFNPYAESLPGSRNDFSALGEGVDGGPVLSVTYEQP